MPTYDQPTRHIYSFPAVNFGAAFTRNIRGPKGRRGRVISAAIQVTASVTAGPVVTVTTTAAPVPSTPKGVAGAANTQVFAWTLPATVAPAGLSSDNIAAATVRDANNNVQILAADSDIVLASAPNAGAGTGDLELTVDWF